MGPHGECIVIESGGPQGYDPIHCPHAGRLLRRSSAEQRPIDGVRIGFERSVAEFRTEFMDMCRFGHPARERFGAGRERNPDAALASEFDLTPSGATELG